MRRAGGFTLLEILVALAILAIAITASFRALGSTALSAAVLHEHQIGDWIAENRLAELRASGAWPEAGSNEGVVVQGGREYRWREDIKSTPNPLFRRVELRVFADGGEHAISNLAGFVVKPLR